MSTLFLAYSGLMSELIASLTSIYSYTADRNKESIVGSVKCCPSLAGTPWASVDDANVLMETLCGGLTNSLFKLSLSPEIGLLCADGIASSVIVRIYGECTELFIDRDWECYVFATLAAANLAPAFYGRFENGRVEGFIDSVTLTPELMANPKISFDIATVLAKYHAIKMDDPLFVPHVRDDSQTYIDDDDETIMQRTLWLKFDELIEIA